MKDLIVIAGTIVLGCIVFKYIYGDESSIRGACGEAFRQIAINR